MLLLPRKWNLAPLFPFLALDGPMSTILLIVLIILLLAALPTIPYSIHGTQGQSAATSSQGQSAPATRSQEQSAPATRNGHAASFGRDPFLATQVHTSRVHRTWSDRLKMWRCAYETKISDSRREVTGRGSSPRHPEKPPKGDGSESNL